MKKLKDVRWRVDVVLSSRDCLKVMEPVVYLELEMESGEVEALEMSEPKFHYLRQNVALLLREFESVKRKGANIVRLMAQESEAGHENR